MTLRGNGGVPASPVAYQKTINVNPGNIPAQTTLDVAVADADAKANDYVLCNASFIETGLVVGDVFCAVDGTITLRIGNVTVGAIDPAAQNFRFLVFRVA